MKLTILTIPSQGHFGALSRLARHLKTQNPSYDIHMIITSWKNFTLSGFDEQTLIKAAIETDIVISNILKNSGANNCTFQRVLDTGDQVNQLCKNSDFIIYDFLSPEGYIAGKLFNIPAYCYIPAIIGPFNTQHPLFQKSLEYNLSAIQSIEKKFSLPLQSHLEMVSECIFIPSEHYNIISSWEGLIEADNYLLNRDPSQRYLFARQNAVSLNNWDEFAKFDQIKQAGKKLIYFSLGTVAPNIEKNTVPKLKQFILDLHQMLFTSLGNSDDYEVIISTGGDLELMNSQPATNFHYFQYVPQLEVLKLADVFVTHAGGNSVNEAIDATVPMIFIPLMFDQHQCAHNGKNLQIGIAFEHPESLVPQVMDPESGIYHRNSLNEKTLFFAISKISNDPDYKKNIQQIKQKPLLDLDNVIEYMESQKVSLSLTF